MEAWIWFAIGLACFALEPILPYLVMTPWGLSFFMVALLAWLWPSIPLAFALLLVLALGTGLHLTLRPLMCYVVYAGKRKSNIESMKLRKVLVKESIGSELSRPGVVRMDGIDWRALSADGSTFQSGEEALVHRIEGSTLLVGGEPEIREEPMPQALWPKMTYIMKKGSAYWIRS